MSEQPPKMLAAIDLGSNSFHILLAEQFGGELRWQEALSEKVQLAAGLNDQLWLNQAAQKRGLECLARFAERVAGVERANLRVVATSTLRVARNAGEFLQQAEALLGCRVNVISGREEARLINLGVAHALADNQAQRLVIDIGGGSTELVIGQGFKALKLESLFMGCVGFTRRFFADGKINEHNYQNAWLAAGQLLQPIEADYRALGWQVALGSSGTVKAVAQACHGSEEPGSIRRDDVQRLRERLFGIGTLSGLAIKGVSPDRCRILPAGLAILQSVMERFGIEQLDYVEGALREGVIHDMVGDAQEGSPADAGLALLARRCRVDKRQAERVARTAEALYRQQSYVLPSVYLRRLLQAASVHEVGLAISHDQYDKHGAYLLQHADLAGFARHEQKRLAQLVRAQRRKLPPSLLQETDAAWVDMIVLLRIAVCLHHARQDEDFSILDLRHPKSHHWNLVLPSSWQQTRPLLCADLHQEQSWLGKADIQLHLHFATTNASPAATHQTASSITD